MHFLFSSYLLIFTYENVRQLNNNTKKELKWKDKSDCDDDKNNFCTNYK